MKGQSEIAYLPKFADLNVKLVSYLVSQSNSLHFELLIDVLAQILKKLQPFQNLTYFLT